MAGSEFLDAAGPDAGDDEVLDTRRAADPRRRLAIGLVAALVLAALISYLVTRGGGRPVATPGSSRPPAPAPTSPRRVAVFDNGTGSAPPVVVGGRLYAFLDGRLLTEDLATQVQRSALLDATAGDGDTFRLFVDPAHDRIWLVSTDSPQTSITAIDSRTLQSITREELLGRTQDADLVDGQLDVLTDQGLATISGPPYGLLSVRPIPAIAIAADPSRHRLLLFTPGAKRLSVTTSGAGRPSSAPAPFGKGDFVVVGGHIWAGGFGPHGAVLAELDPKTLRVIRHSPLESLLGPGAELVGGGQHDLLVRSGGGGDQLWCVDASSGAVVHTWPDVSGDVALAPSGLYGLRAGEPYRLGGGCAG